jgi:hypothetical protein
MGRGGGLPASHLRAPEPRNRVKLDARDFLLFSHGKFSLFQDAFHVLKVILQLKALLLGLAAHIVLRHQHTLSTRSSRKSRTGVS